MSEQTYLISTRKLVGIPSEINSVLAFIFNPPQNRKVKFDHFYKTMKILQMQNKAYKKVLSIFNYNSIRSTTLRVVEIKRELHNTNLKMMIKWCSGPVRLISSKK